MSILLHLAFMCLGLRFMSPKSCRNNLKDEYTYVSRCYLEQSGRVGISDDYFLLNLLLLENVFMKPPWFLFFFFFFFEVVRSVCLLFLSKSIIKGSINKSFIICFRTFVT